MSKIIVTKDQLAEIVRYCSEESPDEACGILSGKNRSVEDVIRMKNVYRSPIRYGMDPAEQFAVLKKIRNEGQEIVGIYHSHTASKAYPSRTDVELAFYPEAAYVIVSLENKAPDIKAYNIYNNEIKEIKIELVN